MRPQILSAADVARRGTGWYLPRGGTRWVAVAARPPRRWRRQLCWWVPDTPPGDGQWAARAPQSTA